ncbi:MAG: pyridoxal-phosphate dependent enzyme [Candidatus Pacebacteria bacterium]|nr:pyridoxal-phosphate dependent enzyme [Candidatus Paceibacterota bacterium]MCF7862694.1 pyridoxal-phosphate dependent enzyme [Candidatus Paceibacterota bacterium]
MKNKGIFEGENGVLDFLTPQNNGFTPIVELPSSINFLKKEKVKIFLKLNQFVPLGNIKSLPSFEMLQSIPKDVLKNTKNLVEYSSGNTVLDLAVLSRHFGIKNLHAIITPDVPENKKRILRLAGANILISHGPPSPAVFEKVGGIYDAEILGQKKGWHNLNQYTNIGNKKASYKYIGGEVWQQLGKNLSIFMASIGTAGTITGAGEYLKKKNKNIKVWGTAIKAGSSIPGPRGEVMIHKLGIDWKKTVDEVFPTDTKNAFKISLDLIRLGLFVGPSTGMQVYALLALLKKYKNKNQLNNLRNKNGEIVCVAIACDTMFPYIDDYFSVLPAKFFPKIKDL